MRQIIIFLNFFFVANRVMAQGNLVPNPSLEDHSTCPTGNGQFYLVTDWNNPTGASPEYFHTCFPFIYGYGVPNNIVGEQNTYSGNAYAGLATYAGPFREYLQTKLLDTLHAGETYCVQFYVSLPGKADLASIAPQLLFSETPVTSTSTGLLPFSPQIFDSTNIVYDTTNWTLVTGEYIAQGGESFITIGNFYDDAHTKFDTVGNTTTAPAYYYLDEVSVYKKANAKAGIDRAICINDSIQIGAFYSDSGIVYTWQPNLGISDSSLFNPWVKPIITTTYTLSILDTGGLYCTGKLVDSVTVSVNDCTPLPQFYVPTIFKENELLFISAIPENSTLELYDARGRLVFRNENYGNDFHTGNLAVGIYAYGLKLADGTFQTGKICIVN